MARKRSTNIPNTHSSRLLVRLAALSQVDMPFQTEVRVHLRQLIQQINGKAIVAKHVEDEDEYRKSSFPLEHDDDLPPAA